MFWSPQQETALQMVDAWLRSDSQVFYLAGYAGTGKTTLTTHLAQDVRGTVLFAAYTGKAAHVLHTKGCEGASTIHKLIYMPREKSRVELLRLEVEIARLRREPETPEVTKRLRWLELRLKEEKEALSQPAFTLNDASTVGSASLVVIDECSMVGAKLGYDLLSFGTKVLVLGDPAQLPPVKSGGFFTSRKPDYMLTEIHRQARDNPIIDLATRVRSGEGLPKKGKYGDSLYVNRTELDPTAVLDADQVLVGRNATRRKANTRIRELRLGTKEWLPKPGDKVVCLRNDHKEGLLNGSLWKVTECRHGCGETVILEVQDGEDSHSVLAHSELFERGEMDPMPWHLRKEAQEFTFGYALTVHKAQGSQWDDVLLLDESGAFGGSKNKWLYTGITRAAKRITIVEM